MSRLGTTGVITGRRRDPLANVSFALRLQTHRGNGVPFGLYQDTACTIPATTEGQLIAAWRDELSDSGIVATQETEGNRPALARVRGKWCLKFEAGKVLVIASNVVGVPGDQLITVGGQVSTWQYGGFITSKGSGDDLQPAINIINNGNVGSCFSASSVSEIQHPILAHRGTTISSVQTAGAGEMFVNGVSVGTLVRSGAPSFPSTNQIGTYRVSASNYLDGYIFSIMATDDLDARVAIENYTNTLHGDAYAGEMAAWSHEGVILAADQSWHQNAIQEPRPVMRGPGDWVMVFTGGWLVQRLGWATSSDGMTWTKNPNPIIGGGNGGVAGNARGGCLIDTETGLEVFYGKEFQSSLYRQTLQADGTANGDETVVLSIEDMPPEYGGYGNMFMAYDADAAVWRILVELFHAPTVTWTLFTCTSVDRVTWGELTEVSGISINGGTTSSGWWAKDGSTYHLYYHGSDGGSDIPTDIYHAHSPDFTTWTKVPGPALPRMLEIETDAISPMDQTADARFVKSGSTWLAIYARTNNTPTHAGKGNIALATYSGGLSDFV